MCDRAARREGRSRLQCTHVWASADAACRAVQNPEAVRLSRHYRCWNRPSTCHLSRNGLQFNEQLADLCLDRFELKPRAAQVPGARHQFEFGSRLRKQSGAEIRGGAFQSMRRLLKEASIRGVQGATNFRYDLRAFVHKDAGDFFEQLTVTLDP